MYFNCHGKIYFTIISGFHKFGDIIITHSIILGHCKLQEVGEYQLYGNVESMDSVELVDSYRDALLLAFSSAKVTGCYDSVKF